MTNIEFARAWNIATLVTVMFSVGLKVTLRELLDSLRNVRAIMRGLAANLIFVPATTIALLMLYHPPAFVSVGFLILAVCPGAPVGPTFTATAQGDVPLATVLMVALVCLSALIAPPFLSVAVANLFPQGALRVDQGAIARLLLLAQLAPLAIGIIFHQTFPKQATMVLRPIATLGNLMLLVVVGLSLAAQHETLAAIRPRGWIGMTLLLTASLMAGLICGGGNRSTRSAIAVTTGLRNAAVGLVIATSGFAGTAAVTAVTAYSLASIFGVFAFSLLLGKSASRGSTEYSP